MMPGWVALALLGLLLVMLGSVFVVGYALGAAAMSDRLRMERNVIAALSGIQDVHVAAMRQVMATTVLRPVRQIPRRG